MQTALAMLAATLENRIAVLTLNNPGKQNALSKELIGELCASLEEMSPETFERVQSLRRQVYDSKDYQEGIRSFLEKRAPRFEGK